MKTITSSQYSKQASHNALEHCEIPREYLEMVCYNLNIRVDFCPYFTSKNCPCECENKLKEPSNLQKFIEKWNWEQK